jgi:aspartyl-tRNA(Asn)/glutamyl-tRNA(Gln) amidotransferase subunit C
MPVTKSDVEHVAMLARLQFTEEEKERLLHHLNDILRYMEQLNELDTTSVEPLAHVIGLSNAFREDVRAACLPREEALRNAPSHDGKFFTVPKVLGDR